MRSSGMELKPATGPQIVYDGEVTREDLDIWNSELEGLFARMGRLFYRTESRRHAEQYVRGLLAPIQRKNGWTIAEYVGEAEPKAAPRAFATPCDRTADPSERTNLPARNSRCPDPHVAIQLGARAGGSQGPVVKSSVSAWYLSLPHLVAVDRWELDFRTFPGPEYRITESENEKG